MIYFIRCTATGYIKIGYSRDPEKRLRDLQNPCPTKLQLLVTVPGGMEEESALHHYFRHLNVRGEWFRCDDELKQLIRIASFEGEIIPDGGNRSPFRYCSKLPSQAKFNRGDSLSCLLALQRREMEIEGRESLARTWGIAP